MHLGAAPVPLSTRKTCTPRTDVVRARGLFAGASVARGVDWCYAEQEPHTVDKGTLKRVSAWREHTPRSAALVEWHATNMRNIYRLGYDGRVDVKCVRAARGPNIYRCHLPKLGMCACSSVHPLLYFRRTHRIDQGGSVPACTSANAPRVRWGVI